MAVSGIKFALLFAIITTTLMLKEISCTMHDDVQWSQSAVLDGMPVLYGLIANQSKILSKMEHILHVIAGVRGNPRDCTELAEFASGDELLKSGVYSITPWNGFKVGTDTYKVYCDIMNDHKGWTVIQKRFDGSIDFSRTWIDYREGFGNINSEFWVGLQLLNLLTQHGEWVLRIEITDFSNHTGYADYDSFHVGDEASSYALSIGSFIQVSDRDGIPGNMIRGAGDSLIHTSHNLNHMKFSTHDRDNDISKYKCAHTRKGAWWYSKCGYSNLNGKYLGPSGNSNTGMVWHTFGGTWRSLKKSEMKIKRKL